MQFRAAIAVFGHMGIELDPAKLSCEERDVLRAMIAQYKTHRGLLHSGRLRRWTGQDGLEAAMVMSQDGAQALLLALRLEASTCAQDGVLRFVGLESRANYALELLQPWPQPGAQHLANADAWRAPRLFLGEALMQGGLALPLDAPHTAWLIHLRRV